MQPYDIYKIIFFKFIGPYGDFVGVNMTLPNYKPTWQTFCWLGLNLSLIITLGYTIVTKDIEIAAKCFWFVGFGLQGLTKYAVLMYYADQIFDKVRIVERIYTTNRDASKPAYTILQRWAKYSLQFAKYGRIPVVGGLGCLSVWPFLIYIQTGVLEFIVPIYIPFVSDENVVGFSITYLYHLMMMLLGASGTCGADFMIVVLVLHLWPMCLIWEGMIAGLNRAVLQESERNSVTVKVYLRKLILIHKEMCLYLEGISHIYYYMIFTEIFTCAEGLIANLFCMNTVKWYPLYFVTVLMFTKLLAYCLLGTIAEAATDHAYNTLLASNWYLLPIREQRYVLLMMSKAQNPTILMAGTLPLNLYTFVSVLKSVYSVGMLLAGND